MQHITGLDVDVMFGTQLINVKQFTVNIEDGSKPVSTRGVTHGWVRGAVTASGEMTLDTDNFKLILDEAKKAGSFQALGTTDISGVGRTADREFEVKIYGCKLRINKLLEVGGEGGEKLEHTIPFDVTDSRFVEINGVPYLDKDHVERIGV
ncbi:phage protein [Marinomonas sp. THO17]|uniref:phage protein n=1 Tax=Marinomonas sp. THO17 TaxID=3149048 RepID=UPI00336BF600